MTAKAFSERKKPPAEPVNLRHLRLRLGKSLRQMALEMDVPTTTLDRAERGMRPLPKNQIKIAAAYGLDPVAQWYSDDFDGR